VLLNFSEEAVEAEVRAPSEIPALFQATDLRDLLTNESVAVQQVDRLRIALSPLGARILTPDGE
jgi:hypothetical protein